MFIYMNRYVVVNNSCCHPPPRTSTENGEGLGARKTICDPWRNHSHTHHWNLVWVSPLSDANCSTKRSGGKKTNKGNSHPKASAKKMLLKTETKRSSTRTLFDICAQAVKIQIESSLMAALRRRQASMFTLQMGHLD